MQIVIAHAERNNDLLARCLPYIRKNIQSEGIFVLTEGENARRLGVEIGPVAMFMDEDALIPGLTLGSVKRSFAGTVVPERRSGWYYQQFLKMAWALSDGCEEWYAVWDSDTFPLKPLSLFDDQHRPLFTAKPEYNEIYFETTERLLGYRRVVDYSFVAENMVFSRKIMRELIDAIKAGNTARSFADNILSAVMLASNPYKAFSEFETYGNYVMKYYPGLYQAVTRKSTRKGARRYGLSPSEKDLARLALRYDVASFERWDRIFLPFIILNKGVSQLLYPFLASVR